MNNLERLGVGDKEIKEYGFDLEGLDDNHIQMVLAKILYGDITDKNLIQWQNDYGLKFREAMTKLREEENIDEIILKDPERAILMLAKSLGH